MSLADAQRALRCIRSRAEEWRLNHIGVIGFSAGGHVAASLATRYDHAAYTAKENLDSLSARPDFAALFPRACL
ncbi:alpha/beta hydrolase [Vibrio sp.]|uniref:alpha/beta hydrolase n=1 Tax=Vibrio sp. TaxID=678 RepID=UPI003D0D49DE